MSEICLDFVLVHKTGKKQLIGPNHTLMLFGTIRLIWDIF